MAKREFRSTDKIVITIGHETIKVKNLFIGARLDDGSEHPVGMYGGTLEIGEMGVSLMHLFRAAMKVITTEFGISIDKAEEFILFCLSEAVVRENRAKNGEDDLDTEIHRIVNRFMENQN